MELFIIVISAASVTYLTMGAFFGLTAGITPGPLMTLVITETLRHSRKEGIKIAIAPLITDLPIIIVTSVIFSRLAQFNIILGIISFLGGLYFAYLGYETIKIKGLDVDLENLKSDSLKKGITANLLNPNPYIFWLTVGIPNAFKAYETSLPTVIMYFLFFYIMLTGSKICVAYLVERSKTFLNNRAFRITIQVLGAALFIFAVFFFYDGIKILTK